MYIQTTDCDRGAIKPLALCPTLNHHKSRIFSRTIRLVKKLPGDETRGHSRKVRSPELHILSTAPSHHLTPVSFSVAALCARVVLEGEDSGAARWGLPNNLVVVVRGCMCVSDHRREGLGGRRNTDSNQKPCFSTRGICDHIWRVWECEAIQTEPPKSMFFRTTVRRCCTRPHAGGFRA